MERSQVSKFDLQFPFAKTACLLRRRRSGPTLARCSKASINPSRIGRIPRKARAGSRHCGPSSLASGWTDFLFPGRTNTKTNMSPLARSASPGFPVSPVRRGLPLCLKEAPRSLSMAATAWRSRIKSIFRFSNRLLGPRRSPQDWLEANLRPGTRFGYDPWLHTPDQVRRLGKATQAAGAELVAVESNPIDAIWTDRPAPPLGKITLHGLRFAGETAKRKLARATAALNAKDVLLVSDPHAVAWLFNIRGHDVAHTPLPLGYASIVKEDKPRLYVDARKLDNHTRDKLSRLADIEAPERLAGDLRLLGEQGKKVLFDAATAPAKLVAILKGAGGASELGQDPVVAMKARKNRAELEGARIAQLRDGAAVVRFLHWFATEAPRGNLSEIDAAQALETFRRDTGKLKDVAFPTIAAAGANAAIPHYRVTNKTNTRIRPGIFLLDWAVNTRTARPTSPAPSRSASQPP